MGERRKWERPQEPPAFAREPRPHDRHLHHHQQQQHAEAAPAAHETTTTSADPVLEKQRQYIKMLEERNRLKKKLAAATTVKEQREREREEAFVTTFNVPVAGGGGGGDGGSTSGGGGNSGIIGGGGVRKNKSSAALLPTRLHHHDPEAKGPRSAPGTTLPLRRHPLDSEDDHVLGAAGEAKAHPTRRRAKWQRPPPGAIGVANRNGRGRLCFPGEDKASGGREDAGDERNATTTTTTAAPGGQRDDGNARDDEDEIEEIEEEYLEESFEEFEDDDDDDGGGAQDDVEIEVDGEIVEEEHDENKDEDDETRPSRARPKPIPRQPATDAPPVRAESKSHGSDPEPEVSALGRTTTELFSLIQNLSRSKQRTLVDLLQKFQHSDRRDSDVKELQSSISDPAIWKQLTAALFQEQAPASLPPQVQTAKPTTATSTTSDTKSSSRRSAERAEPPPTTTRLTVESVIQEQQRWEEEYAREIQAKLAHEREAKERVLREAEARRIEMMRQLEEEEKELELLMEKKRQERLARLRALEEQDDPAPPRESTASNDTAARKAINNKSPDAKAASPRNEEKTKSPAKRSPKKKGNKTPKPSGSHAIPAADTTAERTSQSHDHKDDGGSSASLSIATSKAPTPLSPAIPALDLNRLSEAKGIEGSGIEVRLRLLSTWGKTRAIGLTQICAYDANGEELEVDAASVRLYERQDGRPLPKTHEMTRTISRLFNGVAHTNNDQDMWLGRLSDAGLIEIGFELSAPPSRLCVWNFNSKMCAASTRDLEVFVSGRCVWTGSLPQTFGDEDDNICTWINVLAGAKRTARTTTATANSLADSRSFQSSREVSGRAQTKLTDADHVSTTETSASSSSASSTPIWLASGGVGGAQPTSTQGSIVPPVVLKAEAKNDTMDLEDDAKSARSVSAAGNLTSRRARGEIKSSEKELPAAPDVTHRPLGQELKRDAPAKALPAPSSWDTLEHFSKTSRSRLPQTTTVDDENSHSPFSPTAAPGVSAVDPVPTRKSVASALLAEWRSGSLAAAPPVLSRSATAATTLVPVEPEPTAITGVEIPELPSGHRLRLEILSTWGDPYYVGLSGIEVFDQRGKLVTFADPDKQVTASPASINVLDEYDDDPRVPRNLVDGVNCTCDDLHMWLAPFTRGAEHIVELDLGRQRTLSMVRIWNYNKSRAHTSRGARHVRLWLSGGRTAGDDSTLIFEGEIQRAPGVLVHETDDDQERAMAAWMWGEVILFTRETAILAEIEANDALVRAHGREDAEEELTSEIVASVRSSLNLQRPRTSDKRPTEEAPRRRKNQDEHDMDGNDATDGDGDGDAVETRRPTTSAIRRAPAKPRGNALRTSVDQWVIAEEPQEKSPVLSKSLTCEDGEDTEGGEDDDDTVEGLIRGRRITIRLLRSWGDPNYIGLTQLDVLVGKHGTPMALDVANIDASPRDLATLGYHGDPRTLDKLIDGVGRTCDDAHMWLVPLGQGPDQFPEIRIDLKRECALYGLRIYNYNKSIDDSFRGVKQLSVTIDGLVVSPKTTGFVLRKAPGLASFDFDQILRFEELSSSKTLHQQRPALAVGLPGSQRMTYKTPLIRQDYEPVWFPQGLVLKLVLWNSWGDPYYIGLNGLELYDADGRRLTTRPRLVTAVPYSIADLSTCTGDGGGDDVRIPENLVNGRDKNTWTTPHDSWLAPLASSLGPGGNRPSTGNLVFVLFDQPVALGLVKFWNYTKTPERGVKDLDIYVDDLHVFSGTLRRAPPPPSSLHGGLKGTGRVEDFGQSVLFTTSQAVVDAERRRVHYCGTEEQDVLCINDGQVIHESKAMHRRPDPGAEGVVVDLGLRPMTAMCRQ